MQTSEVNARVNSCSLRITAVFDSLQHFDVRKILRRAQIVDERVSNIQEVVFGRVSILISLLFSHMLFMQFRISDSLRSVSFICRIYS